MTPYVFMKELNNSLASLMGRCARQAMTVVQVLCLCAGLLMICQNSVSAAEPADPPLAELEAGLSGTVQLPDLLNYAYLTSPAISASKKILGSVY